jgi:hypothetical protein
VISARSGLVHYTEGKVFLDDKAIAPKAGEFPDVKEGHILRTELGRAEVLFSPGVFFRIAENSSFRMLSNRLENTAVEVLSGSVLLEAGEVEKGQEIRLVLNGVTNVEITRRGLYRVDFNPARLLVYEGQAVVVASGSTVTVKEGKEVALTGVIAANKFNKETGDAFYRWASRRSGYIAMANMAAAKSIGDSQIPWRSSAWWWNPYFGSFTYIPWRGRYVGPFGYSYYSPMYVDRVYYRPPETMSGGSTPAPSYDSGRSYGGRGGYGSSASSSSGSYSPPAASAPAPAAAEPRGADSGGSRESRGGR